MKLLRQVWEQVRQDRLFSAIYIAGVALAIATTMIFTIVYYVKLAPVYPEYNRANTYIAQRSTYKEEAHGYNNNAAYSLKAVKELFMPLQNAEVVSAEYYYPGDGFIQPTDGSSEFEVSVRTVDPAFFKIYEYDFTEGAPLSDADLASGMHNAVITAGLASRLFKDESGIIGRTFSLDDTDWRICGVIKDPSALTHDAYGQIFIPYTSISGYDSYWALEYMGSYRVRILTSGSRQADAMKAEIADAVRRYNASFAGTDLDGWEFSIGTQPYSYYEQVFNSTHDSEFNWKNIIRNYGIMLLVLLMVPALNLSGIIAGRMENRLPEIGVRQSFGATRGKLIRHILAENLILTIAGGFFGLILAEITVLTCRDWIFTLFDDFPEVTTDTSANILTPDMLFAPGIFIVALTVCLILNILSALIPAWWSLRHPITESLNQKK